MPEPVKSLKSVDTKSMSFDHEPSENSVVTAELATLKEEIATLREALAEKTGIAYEKVASKASSAAGYVSDEATSVATTIREHPAATTTLLGLVGAVGFAIGYVVATASADSKQAWYSRYINNLNGRF